jgi:hypothetical protein
MYLEFLLVNGRSLLTEASTGGINQAYEFPPGFLENKSNLMENGNVPNINIKVLKVF